MPGTTRVLFVCTANQCRSPLAEAIATRESSGLAISFESAGLIDGGSPMPPAGIQVTDELGFHFQDHRSSQLDPSRLGEFDLVLTMAREHSRELVAANPGTWPRVFTVKQFSRWIDGRRWPADEPLGRWLDQEAADRPRSELIGSDAADDITDPVASPPRAWRRLAEELQSHIRFILDAIAPASLPGQDIHSRIR